jgi:hypothetical protein
MYRVISVPCYEQKGNSMDIALLAAADMIRWNVTYGLRLQPVDLQSVESVLLNLETNDTE